MSSSLPKSESTTSLLRSSAVPVSRRSAHHSEHHGSRSHRSHHHQPEGGSGVPDEPCWSDECEASARRPLCQPRHAGGRTDRNGGDKRGHSHHFQQHSNHYDDGYRQEEIRERMDRSGKDRSKSSRHLHPHHHHHNTSKCDLPPAHHHGNARPDRRSSPTPSYTKQSDDTAYFFESKDRIIAGSSTSLNSDQPVSSTPVPGPPTSRTAKRLSTAPPEHDSNLHPIVKSVFGQVGKSVSRQHYNTLISLPTLEQTFKINSRIEQVDGGLLVTIGNSFMCICQKTARPKLTFISRVNLNYNF